MPLRESSQERHPHLEEAKPESITTTQPLCPLSRIPVHQPTIAKIREARMAALDNIIAVEEIQRPEGR